jgi:hypothetical protein
MEFAKLYPERLLQCKNLVRRVIFSDVIEEKFQKIPCTDRSGKTPFPSDRPVCRSAGTDFRYPIAPVRALLASGVKKST